MSSNRLTADGERVVPPRKVMVAEWALRLGITLQQLRRQFVRTSLAPAHFMVRRLWS